jgi:hypothetical protein
MLVDLLSTTMPNFDTLNETLETNFLSKEKFAVDIEAIVNSSDLNYIDAIVEYCERKGVEIEVAVKLVSKPLKEKLRYDATELNYLKRTSRGKLPF